MAGFCGWKTDRGGRGCSVGREEREWVEVDGEAGNVEGKMRIKRNEMQEEGDRKRR